MMTVVSPHGVAIRFNDGGYVKRSAEFTDLYTNNPDNGGRWLAQVPNTWLIEAVIPCDRTRVPDNRVQVNLEDLKREVKTMKKYAYRAIRGGAK